MIYLCFGTLCILCLVTCPSPSLCPCTSCTWSCNKRYDV